MPKFSSPKSQASSVMKQVQGTVLRSVSTVNNYEKCLIQVTKYIQKNKLGSLRQITPESAHRYLEHRKYDVGQKTLDMERQALQCMMRHVTHKLKLDQTLTPINSELPQTLSTRAYPPHQVQMIAEYQKPNNALATEIAYAAGLRAHELLTLRPIQEQAPDLRPSLETKFKGLNGDRYTVTGKGGLTREVLIPFDLVERLEAQKLSHPIKKVDRGIYYTQFYNLGSGNAWSKSFSSSSKRILGWSTGAHGLRHSYAQNRMKSLQKQGISRDKALKTVSQEMGHFRAEITETYLR